MTKVETSTSFHSSLCCWRRCSCCSCASPLGERGCVCRFCKVKGREGAGALENTTSFGFKGCHLGTWHHPSGIAIILRLCVKGNTFHSQVLCENLHFMWVWMGNKWEQRAFGKPWNIIQHWKGTRLLSSSCALHWREPQRINCYLCHICSAALVNNGQN